MPPGPKLSAVLAGVDRSRLADADLVVLAQARARQLAYEQAGQLADLVAIADAVGPDPFPPGGPHPRQLQPGSLGRVGDRRRVDLDRGQRRGAAGRWPGRSCAGCRRCTRPCWPGRSTRTRRRSSPIRCGCLSDEQARAVVEKILPEAAGKTTGQLRLQAGPAGHHHRPGRGPQTLPGGGQTPAGVVRPGRGRHAEPGRAAPTRRPGRRRVRPPRHPGHRPARGRRHPRAGGTTRRCDARPAPRPHHRPATRPRHTNADGCRRRVASPAGARGQPTRPIAGATPTDRRNPRARPAPRRPGWRWRRWR